jgi:hypothetical protein
VYQIRLQVTPVLLKHHFCFKSLFFEIRTFSLFLHAVFVRNQEKIEIFNKEFPRKPEELSSNDGNEADRNNRGKMHTHTHINIYIKKKTKPTTITKVIKKKKKLVERDWKQERKNKKPQLFNSKRSHVIIT